ncbi:MAG: hypothetical protein ACJAYJ_002372 [Saprospiraceae bacterium]|jgi:hypothetical protein
MFGIPVLLFFILPFALIKEHTIIGVLIGILFSWVAAWLWWSYRIVKWRIWAFESINKKDWSKLESKAVAQLLTWSIGHKFEKVEFRSKNEDLIIRKLNEEIERQNTSKFDLEEIEDDLSIPFESKYFYNKSETIGLLILVVALTCFGIFLLIGDEIIYGLLPFFIAVKLFDWEKFKQIYNRMPQIIINEKGINLMFEEFGFVGWDNAENILVNSGINTLNLRVWIEEDFYDVNFPFGEMNVSDKELLKRINIYIKRYYKKVKLN